MAVFAIIKSWCLRTRGLHPNGKELKLTSKMSLQGGWNLAWLYLSKNVFLNGAITEQVDCELPTRGIDLKGILPITESDNNYIATQDHSLRRETLLCWIEPGLRFCNFDFDEAKNCRRNIGGDGEKTVIAVSRNPASHKMKKNDGPAETKTESFNDLRIGENERDRNWHRAVIWTTRTAQAQVGVKETWRQESHQGGQIRFLLLYRYPEDRKLKQASYASKLH